MIKTNYHTHSAYCDGKGNLNEIAEEAVRRGLKALGFSSHAPLPMDRDWTMSEVRLPEYLAELKRLKKEWKGKLEIYTGLEIDYIPGSQSPADDRWRHLGLDYAIGSVHSTVGLDVNPEYRCVDASRDEFIRLADDFHGGSVEVLCESYYTRIAELAREEGFYILGHFDLIKKFNSDGSLFSEDAPWYRRMALTALDTIVSNGRVLEINSGGISRGYLNVPYPSAWILSEARRRNIPIVISSDSHCKEHVDFHFDESLTFLKETGYREILVLLNDRWRPVPIL